VRPRTKRSSITDLVLYLEKKISSSKEHRSVRFPPRSVGSVGGDFVQKTQWLCNFCYARASNLGMDGLMVRSYTRYDIFLVDTNVKGDMLIRNYHYCVICCSMRTK
jgi:hypothetical protein